MNRIKTWISLVLSGVFVGVILTAPVTRALAASNADVKKVVQDTYNKFKDLQDGKNADYIPALAKVPSKYFGITVVDVDGKVTSVGDDDKEFSIQSISKVFTLARVMQDSGDAAVEKGVGVDATGQAFNSIVAIEQFKGHEMNPFVNP